MLRLNKLQCSLLCKLFPACQIILREDISPPFREGTKRCSTRVGSNLSLTHNYWSKQIRLIRQNTLAYFAQAAVAKKKSFKTASPGSPSPCLRWSGSSQTFLPERRGEGKRGRRRRTSTPTPSRFEATTKRQRHKTFIFCVADVAAKWALEWSWPYSKTFYYASNDCQSETVRVVLPLRQQRRKKGFRTMTPLVNIVKLFLSSLTLRQIG